MVCYQQIPTSVDGAPQNGKLHVLIENSIPDKLVGIWASIPYASISSPGSVVTSRTKNGGRGVGCSCIGAWLVDWLFESRQSSSPANTLRFYSL